ncbi:unnamed protein product [Durusdinium trenchii]|uniref:HEAT repeat domain-containing protein n=1 Tax=Durusdinium trenchii TaxID=1381693 RepID=A0ABP0SQD9_9DINO
MALRHQVMNHLNAEDPGQFGKMMDVLRWLSPQIVPHLVAWLHLQRPLSSSLRPKVELMRRLSDSARVRLAAKTALGDKGYATVGRVEELAKLRAALLRDVQAAPAAEKKVLLRYRDQVREKLLQLGKQSEGHVLYAVKRALRH